MLQLLDRSWAAALSAAASPPAAGTSAGGGNPMDGVYTPKLPGGQVGSSITTLIDWTMGGSLAAIVLGLLFCLVLSSFGSASSRPDMAAKGKSGVPICLICLAGVGLVWPLARLFVGVGGS